jgi:hypothetical protein
VRLLAFLSRRLRPLRDLPPLPQLLDAFLWLYTFLFRRRMFVAQEALVAEVGGWSGVRWQLHRFGGIEWRIEGREIGHLHGNGVLDVRLPTRAAARQAQEVGLACEHHTHPGSAWVSLSVRSHTDLPAALTLLQHATANFSGDRNRNEPIYVMIP